MNTLTPSQSPVEPDFSGSYTANILGTIRSHLEALQGYDVMALEIIQNADDAGAEAITFDVTTDALVVYNSGTFSYCGDLRGSPCSGVPSRLDGSLKPCDFHSITEVASGGKLGHAENIGRFGIGFISTYQVTDCPEIHSRDLQIHLRPELLKWSGRPGNQKSGTRFVLPWARDEHTAVRTQLCLSAITDQHIERVVDDIKTILEQSLLFLQHVKAAHVLRNGVPILSVRIDRASEPDILISFDGGGPPQKWLILRTDAKDLLPDVFAAHPILGALKRKSDVTVAVRVAPEPLESGLLYAYLPTQQASGLPLHINADFFPTSSRKAAIFEGHQHQQAWNEALILAAASAVAKSLEPMRDKLGHVCLWKLIGAAVEISKPDRSGHPACYVAYWHDLQKALSANPKVVLAADGRSVAGKDALLSRSALADDAIQVTKVIGITLVSEALRFANNWLPTAGVQQLTLDRLVLHCEHSIHISSLPSITAPEMVETFFRPLWGLFESHFTGLRLEANKALLERLKLLPLGVSADHHVRSFASCLVLPPGISRKDVQHYLPWVPLAHSRLLENMELASVLPFLSLASVAGHLEREAATPISAETLLGTNPEDLKKFYSLIAQLDEVNPAPADLRTRLSILPIWRTGAGFAPAESALLPGNFDDPIGLTILLAPDVFDARTREFLRIRLGVREQSVTTFIESVLPQFFADTSAIDLGRYATLISQLSDHATLLDDDHVAQALAKQPLVPTRDGGWHRPSLTYFYSPILEEVLGHSPHLWVDERRLPNKRSVRYLLTNLGIRTKPSASDLVKRLISIAQVNFPRHTEAIEASGRAFYALCDQFTIWKAQSAEHALLEIAKLRNVACLPADHEEELWFSSISLYAPYRASGFESQAKILAFKNTSRLNNELLEFLGIQIEPPTNLVVAHLRHCIQKELPVSDVAYQILTERAAKGDQSMSILGEVPCLYDKSLQKYFSPSRVFWSTQRLGRYAHTAPPHFASYRAFLETIGVRSAPTSEQFAGILLEICSSHYKSATPLEDEDLAIYRTCLAGLSPGFETEHIDDAPYWDQLRNSPSILNLYGMPRFPDEVLVLDSEWFHTQFGMDIDDLLCHPEPDYAQVYERLGVRGLACLATIELDFSEGVQKLEEEFEARLHDHIDCFLRLLHDKPTLVRASIEAGLTAIRVRSFDQIKIRASVALEAPFVSEARPVAAFYESAENWLTLSRPLTSKTWPQAFNAVLHRLLPTASGADVAKLSAVCWSIVREETIEDAHQYLTDIGIPIIEETEAPVAPETNALGVLGTTTEESAEGVTSRPQVEAAPTVPPTQSETADSPKEAKVGELPQPAATPSTSTTSDTVESPPTSPPSVPIDETNTTPPSDTQRIAPKRRSKSKQQWDQALRSYVRPKPDSAGALPHEADSSKRQHDLAVEFASRKAVCDWEIKHGRQPDQLAQTHPGYDIVSTNPRTGEQRLIEVKGVDGEWNKTGVSVSRTQFGNAQHFGDKYWLYVVEFALDESAPPVRAIKNPALQIEQFMFDSGWREIAEGDEGDPRDAFVEGARGSFGMWGSGTIEKVERKEGGTIVLFVKIDGKEQRTMTLNLQTMRIFGPEDDDGDIDS